MKRIIGYLFYMIILSVLVINSMNYLLVDDSSQYTRLTFHEFYESENIDVLFLGSSHCMYSLNPEIFKKMTKKHTFNAGTSCQYLDGSYAVLREAGKRNKLQKVYIEMYYGQIGQTPVTRGNTTATYIISDYMKPSVNKVLYLLQATAASGYMNSFLPARRNIEDIFSIQKIKNNISNKCKKSYRSYDYIRKGENYYAGSGYIFMNDFIKNGTYGHFNPFYEVVPASAYDLKMIDHIIQYCRRRQVEIVFYSAPMSDFRLASLADYDDYISEIKAICGEYQVPYYDFNLCKREFLDLDERCFFDDNHLNAAGADKFSRLLAEIENKEVNVDDLFYQSYQEKLRSVDLSVYGTILIQTDDGYQISTITNYQEKNFYYTVYENSGSKSILLQKESLNTQLEPLESEHGTLRIITYGEEREILNDTLIDY